MPHVVHEECVASRVKTHAVQRSDEAALGCGRGDIESARDLFQAHSFDVTQHEGRSILPSQASQHFDEATERVVRGHVYLRDTLVGEGPALSKHDSAHPASPQLALRVTNGDLDDERA
jgi:hypothetical protein